jgi:hypothetical protein
MKGFDMILEIENFVDPSLFELSQLVTSHEIESRLPYFLHPSTLEIEPNLVTFNHQKMTLKAFWKDETIELKLAKEKPKFYFKNKIYLDPGHVGKHVVQEGRQWFSPDKKHFLCESELNFQTTNDLIEKLNQKDISYSISRQNNESRLGKPVDQLFLKVMNVLHALPLVQEKIYLTYLKQDLSSRSKFLDQGWGLSMHFNANGEVLFLPEGDPMIQTVLSSNLIMAFVNGSYLEEDLDQKGLEFFLRQLLQPFWEESVVFASSLVNQLLTEPNPLNREVATSKHEFLSYLSQKSCPVQKGVWARALRTLQSDSISLGPKVLIEADLLNSSPVFKFLSDHTQSDLTKNVSEKYFEAVLDFQNQMIAAQKIQ